jgi:basic amino acid/polyamine antiporter, APA family
MDKENIIAPVSSSEGLKRVIGVRALTFNGVNITIGAGIFALPAVVALYLGATAFMAYIICTALLALVLLCFVDVSSKVEGSGGAYAYIEAAFGTYIGFLANTLFFLGFTTMATAAVANVMADNLAVLFPTLLEPLYRIIFFAIIFGGFVLLNIRGSKESANFVFIITLLKLLPLILLIVFGITHIQAENLLISQPPTITALGEGALILFFAFGGGVEASLSASGEIINPKRTIPRAMFFAVLIVFMIYLTIQVVAQGVLGNTLILEQEAPLAKVAAIVFGKYGSMFMVLAAAFSCFGLINGDMLASSRLPFAAAKDGLLPSFLAKVHTKFATPYNAIILYGSVAFIFAISGGFRQLAILSSASILLIYVGVIAATIKLRHIKVDNAFKLPGGITIPVLALLATAWFLSNLALNEIFAVTLFLTFFSVIYLFMRKKKKK